MTLAVAWIVLPLVLSLLSLGCGLLLETVSGMRLPGALLLPGGFIVVSLAAYFAHMTDLTARLETPLVVVLALTGYGLSRPWKRFQLDRWLAGAAAGVYVVFGAPVLFTGQATFTGYIRLDDTATYMAMVDRAATHAYNNTGLHSSTYKAVLHFGYVFGYPLGSLLPLDVGQTIVRIDPLWLWQPYLTFLAVLIALGLYQLVSGLVQSRALRACVAFFGTQAALMYGYAAWGGVKELFLPGVVLFAACLVPRLREGGPARQVIPLAAASAAVISGLSVGGGIWIVPVVVAGLALLLLNRPFDEVLRTVGVYVLAAGVLAIPILAVGLRRLFHVGKFLKGGETGNIRVPLSVWHVFGIWPSGDFRDAPSSPTVTHLLGVIVALAAAFAVGMAWRRGRWEIVAALATAVFGTLVYVGTASAWVAGKALAESSPLVLGIALAGVAMLIESGRRVEVSAIALVVLAVLAGGVLWSNVMQYHAVQLAPSARLMELEHIGSKFSGKGPALLTEFEPYAARHFLRGLDGEATSELRVRPDCLRPGSPDTTPVGTCAQALFGTSPDVDEIRLSSLLAYRTLITRRTGVESRPPSVYNLRWSGRYYDVWVRDADPSALIDNMSLGSRFQPAAVPNCAKVTALADEAAKAHGELATVVRPPAIVIEGDGQVGPPTQWYAYEQTPYLFTATNAYRRTFTFTVPSAGTYGVWLGGSFSSTMTAYLDGKKTGQQSNQTEWPGNFLDFGSAYLTKGKHTLTVAHSAPDLGPGSAAAQSFGFGPFVIAQSVSPTDITYVKPKNAQSLCGKTLDWIEALRG